MEYIPILLFRQTGFNIILLSKRYYRYTIDHFEYYFKDFETARRYLYNHEVDLTYKDELGDSIQYITPTIKYEQFINFMIYHEELYRDFTKTFWEGIGFSGVTCEGGIGGLLFEMMNNNLPVPLDVLIRYLHPRTKVGVKLARDWLPQGEQQDYPEDIYYSVGDVLCILFENFDTSCYKIRFSGDNIGLNILYSNYLEIFKLFDVDSKLTKYFITQTDTM